jgi:ACS family glucarate transporter-like MFS transporter
LGGIVNTAGALAGILSPIVTGWIVTTTKTFNSAFAVAGFGVLAAALLVAFFLGEVKPIELGTYFEEH